MSPRQKLAVSKALWDAMSADVRELGAQNATQIIAVSVFLDALSEDFGMSDEHDAKVVERAARILRSLPFLSTVLQVEADDLEAERLRNRLYWELSSLSADLEGAKAERLLGTAQVHWALSFSPSMRPLLPLKGGEPVADVDRAGNPITVLAALAASRRGVDLATLPRSKRASEAAGVVETSGRALTEEAARTTVLMARRIVEALPITQRLPTTPIAILTEPNGRRFLDVRQDSQELDRARSIYPPSQTAPGHPSGGQTLQQQAREREAAGKFTEAAAIRTAVVEYLRRQSESDPGNHEAALASASLEAGISELLSGHAERAEKRFSDSRRIIEVLVVFDPTDEALRVRLAVGWALTAEILRYRADLNGARAALEQASTIFAELAEMNDEHDDVLAVSLMTLGLTQSQLGNPDLATSSLGRALRITRKVARRTPQSVLAKALLANMIVSVGIDDVASHRLVAAEKMRAESAALISNLYTSTNLDNDVLQLLATALSGLAGLSLSLERNRDASVFLERAVSIAQQLVGDRPEDRRARFVLGVALVSTAVLLIQDDDGEAVLAICKRAEEEFLVLEKTRPADSLDQDLPIAHFYGLALLLISASYSDLDQDLESEIALKRSVETLRSSTLPESHGLRETAVRALEELGNA